MLPFIFITHLALLILSFWSKLSFYEHYLVPIINSIMLCIIICRLGFKFAMHRLLCGQILPLYLYTIWLFIFPQPELLYLLPLFLSCIGKTYLLTTLPDKLEIDVIQSLITFQSKVELIVILHHLIKVISSGVFSNLFGLLLLIMFLKLKYSIHYGTRRAYADLHFGLDRVAKSIGMRQTYHGLHKFVGFLGNGIWKDSKQITY